jgi:hypothetical protein
MNTMTKAQLLVVLDAANGALALATAQIAQAQDEIVKLQDINHRQQLALAKVRREFAAYYASKEGVPDAPKPAGWCSKAELKRYFDAHPDLPPAKLPEIRAWLAAN